MSTPSTITVLAVDDNFVVRAGLVALLEASDGVQVVGEAANGADALELARQLRPDVVLLDVRMPVRDGLSTVEDLSELTKVIMLTHSEESETIRTALALGAVGYLVHGQFTADELNRALRDVLTTGKTPLSSVAASVMLNELRGTSRQTQRPGPPENLGLTERESEIMAAVARGLNNSEVARELYLTEKTVKNHLNRIFRKLAVTNRAGAIARWNGMDGVSNDRRTTR